MINPLEEYSEWIYTFASSKISRTSQIYVNERLLCELWHLFQLNRKPIIWGIHFFSSDRILCRYAFPFKKRTKWEIRKISSLQFATLCIPSGSFCHVRHLCVCVQMRESSFSHFGFVYFRFHIYRHTTYVQTKVYFMFKALSSFAHLLNDSLNSSYNFMYHFVPYTYTILFRMTDSYRAFTPNR